MASRKKHKTPQKPEPADTLQGTVGWDSHAVAVVVCVLFAMWVWMRDTNDCLGGDQTNIVTAIKAMEHPDNFARDPIFKRGRPNWCPPVFLAITRAFVNAFGILGGHRVMQFLLVLGYLLSMYAVLYALTRSFAAALLVALFSSIRVNSLGGSYWGASELLTVQPRTLVLIFVPPLLLLAWRWRQGWRLVAPFAVCGLLININPPGALMFAAILWLTLLITRRSLEVKLKVLMVAGVAFVIGAAPFAVGHILARSSSATQAWPDLQNEVMNVIRNCYSQTACFPITTSAYHHFFMAFGPIFLLGVIGWVLRGDARGPFDRCLEVFFVLAALGMPVAQHLMQAISDAANKPPPILDVLRGQKYAYLVLMIYTAYLVATLLERGTQRDRILIIIAAMMVTFLGSPPYISHNWSRNAEQARALLRGDQVSGEPVALLKLSEWARENTPKGSLFLLMHPDMHWFRMYALRALAVSWKDYGPAFYNGAETTVAWNRWYKAVKRMSYKPSLGALKALVKETDADYIAAPHIWSSLPGYHRVYDDPYWTVYTPPPNK